MADFQVIWEGLMANVEAEEMSDEQFFQLYGFLPSDLECDMELPTETGDFVPTVTKLPGADESSNIPKAEMMPTETDLFVPTVTEMPGVDESPNNSKAETLPHDTAKGPFPYSTQLPENKTEEFLSLTSEDVKLFIDEQDNKNTIRKTLTDINKFRRFLETKGEKRDVHEISVDQLDAYLANFILSIKKSDGSEYEPSSLRNIISSIDRKLQRNKYEFLIMRGSGPQFSLTRDALKAKQKCLKKWAKEINQKLRLPSPTLRLARCMKKMSLVSRHQLHC